MNETQRKYHREYMREYLKDKDNYKKFLECNRKYQRTKKGKVVVKRAFRKFVKDNPTYMVDYGRRIRIERKKKGICIRCGKSKPQKGHVQCKGCLNYLRKFN